MAQDKRRFISLLALTVIYLLVAGISLSEYLFSTWFSTVLACLALPFCIQISPAKKINYRFLVISTVFSVCTFLAPAQTFLYFAWIAALFFLVESFWGRINSLPILISIFAAPAFSSVANIFSFPIRIQLTHLCGKLLSLSSPAILTAGNTISHLNSEFTVDPACMGLNMLTSSFIIGILLLGFYQKKQNRVLNFWQLLIFLVITFTLNILSNLIRMVLLIHFCVMPDTFLHELIGILCFVIQVVLPIWGVAFLMVRYFGKSAPDFISVKTFIRTLNTQGFPFKKRFIVNGLVCAFIVLASIGIYVSKQEKAPLNTLQLSGYEVARFNSGTLKLEDENALIYVKHIRWFFDSEHNPMICWKGSGYEISNTQETSVGSIKIYTGKLQSKSDTLFTAWWYSDGNEVTNNQLHWRKQMLLQKSHYSLINITCNSKEELDLAIKQLRQNTDFNNLVKLFSKNAQ